MLIDRRKHKTAITPYDVEDIFDGESSHDRYRLSGDAVIVHGNDGKPIKVVANLPYYITTPAITALLECGCFKSVVVMVQKEVAKRMIAKPGGKDYGALTVTVGYFSEAEIEFIVPPHCFIPQPNVDSAVITLKLREEPPFELDDQEYFFKVVRAAFCQRRKMLANSLTNAQYLGITRETAVKCIEEIGKNSGIRGEVLSPEEFGQLSNLLLHNSSF